MYNVANITHKVLPLPQLPIEAVMPDLLAGIETHTQLILKAAPVRVSQRFSL